MKESDIMGIIEGTRGQEEGRLRRSALRNPFD